MRFVLHIGAHKTGSTFIQNCLSKNREWLRQSGIYYKPSLGRRGLDINHHGLVLSFNKQKPDKDNGNQLLQEMVLDAKRLGTETILISSEVLCEGRIDISDFLAPILAHGKATAIAYMRKPDDLLASAYNQLVRSPLTRWTEPYGTRRSYDPTYKSVLSRWMRPDVRLVLAPYDFAQWIGGTIVADLLSMLGVSDMSGLDECSTAGTQNTSLPAPLLDVIRLFNELEVSDEDHRKFVNGLSKLYRENPQAFNSYDIMTAGERMMAVRQLEEVLDEYRPYFRSGFDESFLTRVQ